MPRKTQSSRPAGRTVVVFDPSAAVRAAADKQLSDAGYGVVTTGDGARVTNLARAADAGLVLCERSEAGFQALHALQADPRTAAYPVMFLIGAKEKIDKDEPFRF